MLRASLLALALHGAMLWLASAVLGDRPGDPGAATARSSAEISVEIVEPIRPAHRAVDAVETDDDDGSRSPAAPAMRKPAAA